ncbi:hypothetical protein LCGC14_1687640 [marine sediment metagenome]|uniref:Uncharacterized protein n=1 Tax=marine sediment metagenome TaxID=412755 RepID=A0A0F9HLU7_9ZZZZ
MSGSAKAGIGSQPPTILVQKGRSRTPEEQAKKDAQKRNKALRAYNKGKK